MFKRDRDLLNALLDERRKLLRESAALRASAFAARFAAIAVLSAVLMWLIYAA